MNPRKAAQADLVRAVSPENSFNADGAGHMLLAVQVRSSDGRKRKRVDGDW
jgi:hypothetical protein